MDHFFYMDSLLASGIIGRGGEFLVSANRIIQTNTTVPISSTSPCNINLEGPYRICIVYANSIVQATSLNYGFANIPILAPGVSGVSILPISSRNGDSANYPLLFDTSTQWILKITSAIPYSIQFTCNFIVFVFE